MYKQYSTVA